VIVQSFDFRILHAMRELAPEMRRAALVEHGREDFASIARDAGAEIVAPQYGMVTPTQVEAAHRKSVRVIPWTPNSRGNWQRLLRMGVDGIITDDPAGLIEFLSEPPR
jgi:glycerophosphoryl diester phosphodiesterase